MRTLLPPPPPPLPRQVLLSYYPSNYLLARPHAPGWISRAWRRSLRIHACRWPFGGPGHPRSPSMQQQSCMHQPQQESCSKSNSTLAKRQPMVVGKDVAEDIVRELNVAVMASHNRHHDVVVTYLMTSSRSYTVYGVDKTVSSHVRA